MALIQLTTAMTESEERTTQNSNNSFLNADKISTSQKGAAGGVMGLPTTLPDVGQVLTMAAGGTVTGADSVPTADNATNFINAMFRSLYNGYPCPDNNALDMDLSNAQASINVGTYYVEASTGNCPPNLLYGIRLPVLVFNNHIGAVIVLELVSTTGSTGRIWINVFNTTWSGWKSLTPS